MEEHRHLANFLEVRYFETGNRNYASASLSAKLNRNIDASIMREFNKYRALFLEACSVSEKFDERITIAWGRAEELIRECFPGLTRFLISLHTNYSIFEIKLVFELNIEVELKFSLFTIEDKYFHNYFGKQLIRYLQEKRMKMDDYIDYLFVVQKRLGIGFSELEAIWRHLVTPLASSNLWKNYPFLPDEAQKEMLLSRLKFFRIISGASHLVSHCWENREKLLFLEKGSYDVFDPLLPFPNVPEILLLFRHEEPHYRNVFFRFYLTHITLGKFVLGEKLPQELVSLILGKFIYYEK